MVFKKMVNPGRALKAEFAVGFVLLPYARVARHLPELTEELAPVARPHPTRHKPNTPYLYIRTLQ